MATESFTKQEFYQAVYDGLVNIGRKEDAITLREVGYVDGEVRYSYILKDIHTDTGTLGVLVQINSSIGRMGLAAPTAKNSIRIWLTDHEENPIGNKFTRWITRQPGWADRIQQQLQKITDISENIQWCSRCNSLKKVWITKKDGPNKGRLFVKCGCNGSFRWLDEFDQEDESRNSVPAARPVQDAGKYENMTNVCPKCGSGMRVRYRRSDGNPFWSCDRWPSCNGTRNIEDVVTVPEVPVADPVVAVASQPKTFVPSKYQLGVFDWVRKAIAARKVRGVARHCRSLMVAARAGSGKTTTGEKMLDILPKDLDVLFIAFNKHIVKAMRQRNIPKNVTVRTYNSLGWSACRNAFGSDTITGDDAEDKVLNLVKAAVGDDEARILYPQISKLVALVKANLTTTSEEDLDALAQYHSLDLNGDREKIFQVVDYVISNAMRITNIVDYDDQCWLPIIHNLPMKKYDVIFIDEFQDTNKCNLQLAWRSVKDDGIIIGVGDEYQSLYGFRGADADAIPNAIQELDADVLPLSITYRNPKSHVRRVNERFPEIGLEAAEWAEEGIITEDIHISTLSGRLADGDMVLCRTNAPLVRPCFELIRMGIKATIRGRDVGKGLVALVRKMMKTAKPDNIVDLIKALEEYRDAEVGKLTAANKGSQAQSLQDKVDTIIALCDGVMSIQSLVTKIEGIFSDDVEGVVFSSVHRAKGLEADRVFILRPDLMPHPMAKLPWELQQERNVEYVALTRAMKELHIVQGIE